MERDQNKSSPEKPPSEERRRGGSPQTLTGGLEDVVSSSFNAPREEATVVVEQLPSLTPTRLRIGEQGGGLDNVGGSQEASGRKRGRGDEQGGSSGGKGKKKGELTDPPSTDPKCATCGKTFGSWKAVFGHLRSHPERDYRGAFPPPKIWEEMLRQEAERRQHAQDQGSSTEMEALEAQHLASTLLNVARDVSSKLSVGVDNEGEGSRMRGTEGATATCPPSGRGLGIDLNDPEELDSPPRKSGFPFDLNMPAPDGGEDDDNN